PVSLPPPPRPPRLPRPSGGGCRQPGAPSPPADPGGARPGRGGRRPAPVGGVREEGSGARDRWRGRLGDPGRPLGEPEALELLADWGIPVVAAEVVASAEEARAAAERIGWPVALKTAAPGVAHKSEVGGVRLGVGGPERL